jgi:hypothetical protein
MIDAAHWPAPLATLYYYKLASRRANILEIFQIKDPNPIFFDVNYSARYGDTYMIQYGELLHEIDAKDHPEKFIDAEGRFRNYGY